MPHATKPLNAKAYGHIPHLPSSRMGAGDHHCHEGQARMCCEKRRDKHDVVIVQEKVDGSCVSVALLNGELVPLIRAGYRAADSPHRQHHLFDRWVHQNADRFRSFLREGERVCGEWLAMAHGTKYELPHDPFVMFDVMVGANRVKTVAEMQAASETSGLSVPRILHVGDPISISAVVAMLEPSGHGALDPVEGAVWRVERKGVHDFIAKFVRHDKQDGSYFADGEVWNKWSGRDALLATIGVAA